jgi:hypothetical protein
VLATAALLLLSATACCLLMLPAVCPWSLAWGLGGRRLQC